MQSFKKRLLARCLFAGVVLAIIGHILADVFLSFNRHYSGSAFDPANERVRWQTPMVMAVLGMLLTAFMELSAHLIRQAKLAKAKAIDPQVAQKQFLLSQQNRPIA